MITEVTEGVKVGVSTQYIDDYSNPEQNHFIFTYCIVIENQNPFAVQLLRRNWSIWDSLNGNRLVEGEGVVGQQPILAPGESYTYESACNLTSEFGSMKGLYTFKRMVDDSEFNVSIPIFYLEFPSRKN